MNPRTVAVCAMHSLVRCLEDRTVTKIGSGWPVRRATISRNRVNNVESSV